MQLRNLILRLYLEIVCVQWRAEFKTDFHSLQELSEKQRNGFVLELFCRLRHTVHFSITVSQTQIPVLGYVNQTCRIFTFSDVQFYFKYSLPKVYFGTSTCFLIFSSFLISIRNSLIKQMSSFLSFFVFFPTHRYTITASII